MKLGLSSEGISLCMVWVIWSCTVQVVDGCPRGCTCTIRNKKGDDSLPGRKVVCRPKVPFSSIEQIEPKFPVDTLQLDLSENALTSIVKTDLNGLSALQKLDLSHNQIAFIEPGSFERLQNLERLDLTANKLSSVNRSMFEGLAHLQRLSLSGNQIKSLEEGTFDPLTVLKRIDFESDYLTCDCHLSWIVKWVKATNVRINSDTKCAVPTDMKDKAVKSLKKKDLHCNWPVELPLFDLVPNTNQVVFQGDKLPFQCKASVIEPSMRLVWVREDREVTDNTTQGVSVQTEYSPDRSVLVNRLVLDNLLVQDSGIWKCMVVTSRGNVSQVVNIVVISEDTLYCPPVKTRTNKGDFTWPKTVSGVTVEQPCDTGRSSGYAGHNPPRAFHICKNNGQWGALHTSQCQYESEKTKVLEQFSKVMSEKEMGNVGNMTKRAEQLRDYLLESKLPTDKMDVIFVGRIVDRLGHFVQENDRLSEVILSIVSQMMEVEPQTLTDAQMHDEACTKMVEAVDSLPSQQLRTDRRSLRQAVKNIAIRAYTIKSSNFPGFSCIVKDGIRLGFRDNSLSCNKNPNFTESFKGNEAIIHLPGSTFDSLECNTRICSKETSYQLQFIMYQNSALFPLTGRRAETSDVASMIVSSRIVGSEVSNMTEPVKISLKTERKGGNPLPVFWTTSGNGPVGQWSSEGCEVVKTSGFWVTFECDHLTHFAILQDKAVVQAVVIPWYMCVLDMGAAVYAGSAVLWLAACAVCLTYLICYSDLKMPNKCKHSIANLCLSLLLLVLIFTFGIRMTGHELACQIMGISLHYLSICTLFWILINAYNMYKKFLKAQQPPEPEPEPSDGGPLPPKPMLRFYLVGWGIALIVCGITAAVNVNFYADDKPYCFLSYEPILGAFFVPVGILFTIICIFFIRIACLLRGVSSFMPIDEPETEEINELELTSPEIESLPNDQGDSSVTPSSSEVDLEYRPISQLRALAIILLLYVLMWTCGALAIALPFPHAVPNQELIFTYSYAFFATILALFLFVYYCVGRHDARRCWRRFCCCERRPVYIVNGSVHNTNNIVHANGHVLRSSSSLDSQFTNKSNSTNRPNPLKNIHPKKQSNFNLVPSQTASVTDHTLSSIHENVPSFYNPRQNGVAKRYWEKKGKNKQINLLMKEANSMRSGSVSSFSTEHNSNKENDKNSNLVHDKDGSEEHIYSNIEQVQVQNHAPPPKGSHDTRSQPSSPKPMNVDSPPLYSSLPRPHRTYSPLTVEASGLLPVTQSSVSPVMACPQPVMGLPGGSVYQPRLMQYNPTPMPPLQQPAVVDYPSIPPPPSYGVNLNPVMINTLNEAKTLAQMHSNSLPRLGKAPYNSNKQIQRNGSIPRLRDLDNNGQNATSHTEPRRPSINTEIRNLEMYKPPVPPVAQPPLRQLMCEGDDGTDQEVADSLSRRTDGNGTGRRKKKKCDSFMDELEQRIPNNRSSPCPSLGRSHSGGVERHNRASSARPSSMSQESDVTSALVNHPIQGGSLRKERNRRSRSYDPSTANQRHSHSSNNTAHEHDSRRAKDWDEEFKDKPKKGSATYAYVNHTYQDKVMSKLIQQSSNGLIDPIARGLSWLPRSVSAYEAVNSEPPTDAAEESSSSSSSDDSTDDIWVLQKRKKKKFKKETSV